MNNTYLEIFEMVQLVLGVVVWQTPLAVAVTMEREAEVQALVWILSRTINNIMS